MTHYNNQITIYPIVIGASFNAYSIIRSFGEVGIHSILVTNGCNNFVKSSKYLERYFVITDPGVDEPAFVNGMLELGKSLQPSRGMLFPTHDEQLMALARHREELEPYFEFPFSEYKTLEKIMNKSVFSEICKSIDVPTIREKKVTSFNDAIECLNELRFPLIVKVDIWNADVIKTWGGKIKIFFDSSAFKNAIHHFYSVLEHGELLVQEYIEESDRLMPNVNSVSDRDGNLQCIFVSEKLRNFPPQTGTSTATNAVNPEREEYREIIEYTKRIIKALHFYGLFGIEYKYDKRDNLYKVIEMNPRSEFPNYLQTMVGQNMPVHLYRIHIGVDSVIPYYPKVKRAQCIVPVNDWFYCVIANRRIKPAFALTTQQWRKTLFKPRTLYGLTVDDICPFFSAYCLSALNCIKLLVRLFLRIPQNVGTFDYLFKGKRE